MRNIKIIFPELGLGSLYQAQVYIRNKETDWSMFKGKPSLLFICKIISRNHRVILLCRL